MPYVRTWSSSNSDTMTISACLCACTFRCEQVMGIGTSIQNGNTRTPTTAWLHEHTHTDANKRTRGFRDRAQNTIFEISHLSGFSLSHSRTHGIFSPSCMQRKVVYAWVFTHLKQIKKFHSTELIKTPTGKPS